MLSLSFFKMFLASPHSSAMSLSLSTPGKYIQTPNCRDHTSPVVSSGLPQTASNGPLRAANCCTNIRRRPSCSADVDCKSINAKSTRCRTDCRIASSPVVQTTVAQCSSCAALTQSCARRALVDTTKHVCNAAGARHLAGARASGDTRIAGELNCKSLMKCGPSKNRSRQRLRPPLRNSTHSGKSIARITHLSHASSTCCHDHRGMTCMHELQRERLCSSSASVPVHSMHRPKMARTSRAVTV